MSKRHIVSFLIVGLMIFTITAVAGAGVFRMDAKVPEGKTLKAYTFTITYDAAQVEDVKAEALGFTAAVNDKESGKIIVNGFNTDGVVGPASVPVVKIKVKGSAKDAKKLFGITVDAFGSLEEKFESEAMPVFVVEEE